MPPAARKTTTPRKTTTRKAPADRLPKKPKPTTGYPFTWQGATYELPAAEATMEKVSGKVLRDAFMDGDEGQARLSFVMLESCSADPAALEALYAMPAARMLEHIEKWMSFAPAPNGASLGESSSSPG